MPRATKSKPKPENQQSIVIVTVKVKSLKVYALTYSYSPEAGSHQDFEDVLLLPAKSSKEAIKIFESLAGEAAGLMGTYNGKRILYPLRDYGKIIVKAITEEK